MLYSCQYKDYLPQGKVPGILTGFIPAPVSTVTSEILGRFTTEIQDPPFAHKRMIDQPDKRNHRDTGTTNQQTGVVI